MKTSIATLNAVPIFCCVFFISCSQPAETQTASQQQAVQRVRKSYRPSGVSVTDSQVIKDVTADSGYTEVNLNLQSAITDKSLKHIADTLPELQVLFFDSPKITDGGFKHIGRLRKLERLSVGSKNYTEAAIEAISELTELRELELDNDKISARSTKHLKNMTKLEILYLGFGKKMDDEGLSYLAGMNRLKEFDVGGFVGCEVTDVGLGHIGKMKAMEKLSINAPAVSDKGLEHLAGLPRLVELTIWYADHVTHEGVAQLSQNTSLESLRIFYGKSDIDGPGLASLVKLKNLKTFATRNVSDAAMAHIGKLTQLQELDIAESHRIKGDGLSDLKGLVNLKELSLSMTGAQDQHLAFLSGMTKLEKLFMTKTKITDAGLKHLHGLNKLEDLGTGFTKVTPEGREELKKILPNMR